MMDMTMDATEDQVTKRLDTQSQSQQDDRTASLSDEKPRHLTVTALPSRCRRNRPKLHNTRSFPPYSQQIGGLGEDSTSEDERWPGCTRFKETREDGSSGGCQKEKGTDKESSERSTREERKVKWRTRRGQKSGGSFNSEMQGREAVGEEKREGSSSLESPVGPEGEAPGGVSGEGGATGSKYQRWSCPHPRLSKLLHSSTTSSTSSSINLSSPESDDVFSEGEDAATKRGTLKKSHSWKTLRPVMYWTLRRQSSWVQLGGHQGNFELSEGGEVLKLYSQVEANCLDSLMRDPLRPFVPQYHGLATRGERCYIRLEDLLKGLRRPVVMDCKMGVRTYHVEELIKANLRSDMYQKMLKADPTALSPEEHAQKGVTKWRYLQWRDTTNSTSTLGFRIEGIMMENGSIQRDFRKIKTLAQLTEALLFFTRSQLHILKSFHTRLLELNDALRNSPFFRTHEVIGSSLLFVHDQSSTASVWMIDFAKTTPVLDTGGLRHDVPWSLGSREDGYLIGLTSLTASLSHAISVASKTEDSSIEEEGVLTEEY